MNCSIANQLHNAQPLLRLCEGILSKFCDCIIRLQKQKGGYDVSFYHVQAAHQLEFYFCYGKWLI